MRDNPDTVRVVITTASNGAGKSVNLVHGNSASPQPPSCQTPRHQGRRTHSHAAHQPLSKAERRRWQEYSTTRSPGPACSSPLDAGASPRSRMVTILNIAYISLRQAHH